MNAIEMAIKTMLEKSMAGMMDRLPELLASLPPDMLDGARQTFANVAGLKAQLDRIENQQRMILDHLKIPDDTVKSLENGDARSERTERTERTEL